MMPIHWFSPVLGQPEPPAEFPSPFNDSPSPLARKACEQLQAFLKRQSDWRHDFDADDGGKMFGVLVVRDDQGRIGFLAAFSGMLAGQWLLPSFVPPVFDVAARAVFFPAGESELDHCLQQIRGLEEGEKRCALLLQLEALAQRHNAEHAELKALHHARKRERHKQREELKRSLSGVDEPGQEKILARLSFESQQDRRERRELDSVHELGLVSIKARLATIKAEIDGLKKARGQLSRYLHKKIFSGYVLMNGLGEQQQMTSFFEDKNPPGGSGDCAAPKLIHYARQQGLTPLALAEFWWGASPSAGVRHHGQYYPACRGKCRPILPFMLAGIRLQAAPRYGSDGVDVNAPATVYEDECLLVVNKPSGLLSAPGKELRDSVIERLRQRYAHLYGHCETAKAGPWLVHRLDMATSGLLLVAKDRATHKRLQRQFLARTIEKRYVAVLDGVLRHGRGAKGLIELPLRVDLDDRPRQLVCLEHGKPAITRWEIISPEMGAAGEGRTRVYFYPLTGRTHQLRMHASHRDGLNIPIVGDELYGRKAERLMLHAQRLGFDHPATGERIELEASVPF